MPKRERPGPIGPTGQFPRGRLNDSDQGELAISIGTEQGVVVMNFGTPTAWVGFPPAQARDIAAMLVKHADHLERRAN